MSNQHVSEAIRIAAPGLNTQELLNATLSPKVAETRLKYLLRMSTRCTPFGLFAGGTVGYFGTSSTLDFTNRQARPHHRLDMQVLTELAYALSNRPELQHQLRYVTNQTLYQVGQRLRYTERQWLDGQWHYFSSEVPAESSILKVLALARQGATRTELAQAIASPDQQAEAYAFIDCLIEDCLLTSELLPAPTGIDPFTHLVNTIRSWPTPPDCLPHLIAIQDVLTQSTGKAQPTEEINFRLTLGLGLSLSSGPILQTDTCFDESRPQLSGRVLQQLEKSLSALHVLSHFNAPNDNLVTFKQRFYDRYEEQEIPLLAVLDEEIGIGYGNALTNTAGELIEGLVSQSSTDPSVYLQDALHQLRIRLYTSWDPQRDGGVTITDDDLLQLTTDAVKLPDSYYAIGYFLASSTESIDAGQYQFYLKALSGPSGFNLFGRFCSADEELSRLVTDNLARRQQQDAHRIYAEVVHLPQPRTGNVVARPHLRPYEIPYLTHSTLPTNQQLSLDDLLVSVPHGQRIVLRSKQLGKEVIPQLTTAHDYNSGLPLYRFLCDLQHQQASFSVSWHWGALVQARRLPRVKYRNIILQEATWLLSHTDLVAGLTDAENVCRLQQQEGLPALIALQEGDQELFLDLRSPICQQLFTSTIRRLKSVRVIEWLRTPENCPVQGPDGKMTHEVVIPFTNISEKEEHRRVSYRVNVSPLLTNQRSFSPGSEWLYLKVYCGCSTADVVLNQLSELIQQGLNSGQLKYWFFVRYFDPDFHLRIRFRLSSQEQAGLWLTRCQAVLSSLTTSGEIHKVRVDTYHRELERYGEAAIEPTEYLFWRESEFICQLHQMDLTPSDLLRTAIQGIDLYQTVFGLSPEEKLQVCDEVYQTLFAEHGGSASLRQTLAKKYRDNQPLVMQLFEDTSSTEPCPVEQLFGEYRLRISTTSSTITAYLNRNSGLQRRQYIAGIAHMFVNRLFTNHQRTYELLVYHHLQRVHQTRLARHSIAG
ncbi:hypothetical protein GCM10023187_53090 [Nibrella viscosa]|uniref:Thiopeptide-type bacteriocin biosynthesis domain-containing protein n=1 Tax=Nibrella viscosa TaxID=1084524 RepID=A0ABP8KZ80_9BACT